VPFARYAILSMRHVTKWVTLALALSTTTLWVGPAGAATPTQGSIVPGSAVPTGPVSAGTPDSGYTPGQPFGSGQIINVVVPANDVLPVDTDLQFVECSAPNGVIPTQSSACDGNTLEDSEGSLLEDTTVKPNPDGSVNLIADSDLTYAVLSLPDSTVLGENSGGPECGDTAATECIIYIGDDYLDLSQPNVWSQPFFVAYNSIDNGDPAGDGSLGTPPADVLPEAPSVIAMPAIAVGLVAIGAGVQARRRRRRLEVTTAPNCKRPGI
jgi:hypothetical protein